MNLFLKKSSTQTITPSQQSHTPTINTSISTTISSNNNSTITSIINSNHNSNIESNISSNNNSSVTSNIESNCHLSIISTITLNNNSNINSNVESNNSLDSSFQDQQTSIFNPVGLMCTSGATNCGWDSSDLYLSFRTDLPPSIEDAAQEAGGAGRRDTASHTTDAYTICYSLSSFVALVERMYMKEEEGEVHSGIMDLQSY
eukprot:CAMPEP_0184874470 /NCGR_PEP_ID=MMETSP0580-20130426/42418_1 /TAXON_ID=1118495 /ORGANISM="Dactyliosolen fragilissimus" /LENGTH=201 /DNA_ID=CAMNT_0027377497 /DNA_START=398 /DNA_END=1003 /DNA_ORIENTATION=+